MKEIAEKVKRNKKEVIFKHYPVYISQ